MYRRDASEMRVLILTPTGRDGSLLAKTLEIAKIDAEIIPKAEMLLPMMAKGFGAAIIADEAVTSAHLHRVTEWLYTQPPWSDPPFIILTTKGRPSYHTSRRAQELLSIGNFTSIERPVRPETILSAVRSGLRARMKQYEVRSRQEALLQANTDLEHFAHAASHDLQEPLRNISIFSELLLSELGTGLNERHAGCLRLVRDNSKRMGHLLADLRSYALASNISDEVAEPIPAAKPLEVALANLAVTIRETEAHITIGELPKVRMREIHLAQLFQNLIGNALKYRRESLTPQVSVTALHVQGRFVFSIADNGIGIGPEYKESIFGIFKRLHTNSTYSGTGMGLAICQRIVERYLGRIWVESKPGMGSTFFFAIPA